MLNVSDIISYIYLFISLCFSFIFILILYHIFRKSYQSSKSLYFVIPIGVVYFVLLGLCFYNLNVFSKALKSQITNSSSPQNKIQNNQKPTSKTPVKF